MEIHNKIVKAFVEEASKHDCLGYVIHQDRSMGPWFETFLPWGDRIGELDYIEAFSYYDFVQHIGGEFLSLWWDLDPPTDEDIQKAIRQFIENSAKILYEEMAKRKIKEEEARRAAKKWLDDKRFSDDWKIISAEELKDIWRRAGRYIPEDEQS